MEALKSLSLGALIGLMMALALGWYPHLPAPQKSDWITDEDRARAKDVPSEEGIPQGWRVVKYGSVTVCKRR